MKPKQVIFLSIILGVLVLAVLVKQNRRPVELVKDEYVSLDFSFEKENVSRIEITRFAKPEAEESEAEDAETESLNEEPDRVELVKSDKKWKSMTRWNVLADEKKIDELLEEVLKTTGELRADDKKLFSDFGIADDESYRVILSDKNGKNLLNFRIGTKKADHRYLFVRKEGSAKVFLTETNLFGKMGVYGEPGKDDLQQDYWVDMSLVDFSKESVTSVVVRRLSGENPFTSASVEKYEDPENAGQFKWRYRNPANPFAVDAGKIQNYLQTLLSTKTGRVIDPESDESDLSNPSLQILVKLQDGDEIVILSAEQHPESKGYPTQVSGQPAVFSLSEYHYNQLNIDDSKFYVSNPLRVDVNKTKELKIKAESGKFDLNPMEKKWDGLTKYLTDVRNVQVKRILYDSKEQWKVKSPGKYSIEILKDGTEEPMVLDVGSSLDEEATEYAAKLRSSEQVFAIDKSYFEKLFWHTDRLEAPPETVSPPAPAEA